MWGRAMRWLRASRVNARRSARVGSVPRSRRCEQSTMSPCSARSSMEGLDVYRYTMSKQSGRRVSAREEGVASVHWYTMSKQSAALPRWGTRGTAAAPRQGLTPVHFSAQRKRFLWDRGMFRGCSWCIWGVVGGIIGCLGCILCQKRLRLS